MATDIYQGRKGSITGEILNFRDSGAVRADSASSLTEAQQAQARANIGAGASNRNLLMNPWYTVNQRGAASYTANAALTVDRWRLYSYSGAASVAPTDDGITLSFGANSGDALYQVIPSGLLEEGEDYTASVLLQDGTVESYTFTFAAASTFIQNGSSFRFHIIGTWGGGTLFGLLNMADGAARTLAVRAMKLEKGSYSTLGVDSSPNYAEELARCQFYFERIRATSNNMTLTMGTAGSASVLYAMLAIKPKASQPTISPSVNLLCGQNALGTAVSAVSWHTFDPTSGFGTLVCTTSGLTAGAAYRLGIGYGAYIDFSADL